MTASVRLWKDGRLKVISQSMFPDEDSYQEALCFWYGEGWDTNNYENAASTCQEVRLQKNGKLKVVSRTMFCDEDAYQAALCFWSAEGWELEEPCATPGAQATLV